MGRLAHGHRHHPYNRRQHPGDIGRVAGAEVAECDQLLLDVTCGGRPAGRAPSNAHRARHCTLQ